MKHSWVAEAVRWGLALWLFGYIAGIVLFMLVPQALIGWVLTPIGSAAALWVIFKKVKQKQLPGFVRLGVVWLVIAVVCDYFFLVQVFKPEDGYYKLDVYVYYALTLLLPIAVGWWKTQAYNRRNA